VLDEPCAEIEQPSVSLISSQTLSVARKLGISYGKPALIAVVFKIRVPSAANEEIISPFPTGFSDTLGFPGYLVESMIYSREYRFMNLQNPFTFVFDP
jgi:hypothetical protein